MDASVIPTQFNEFERVGWEASASQYESAFTPLTRQTIPTFLEALGGVDGKAVLEVACGPGDLAIALSEAGAVTTACDIANAMVAMASARPAASAVQFFVDDAERLTQVPDASQDAVVMSYGILHLADPQAAIESAGRVLRPGGVYAFSCWQPPSEARGFAAVLEAVKSSGAVLPPIPQGPDFFQFADPAAMRSALEAAGFIDVKVRDVAQTWQLPSGVALFEAFEQGTARTGGMLRALGDPDRQRVAAQTAELADSWFGGPGGLTVPMPARVASGVFGR